MEPSSPSSATLQEGILRRSLTRRIACGKGLPSDIARDICRGDIDRLIASSVPLQIKGRCTAVRHDHPAAPLLIKRHTWGGLSRTLRMLWRTPAARRCARLSQRLADAGIPTPLPRATVEDRFGPFGYRSYLVSDYVPGTSLYHFVRENKLSEETARRLARQVACIWQQLDNLDLSHNDMKPENFIVDPQQKVWLIDLERVRSHRKKEALRPRQLTDLSCFFHPRTWKHCPETARVFHGELFQTEMGRDLRRYAEQAGRQSEIALEIPGSSSGLSVVVLRSNSAGTDAASAEQGGQSQVAESIASVADIADEVLVFDSRQCNKLGGSNLRLRLYDEAADDHGSAAAESTDADADARQEPAPRCPWVLVLYAGERVTPDLARELQETVAADPTQEAFRISVKQCWLGRPLHRHGTKREAPIRLMRCAGTSQSIEAAENDAETSTGRLKASLWRDRCRTVGELVTQLNDRSTVTAQKRLRSGEKDHLLRAFARLPLRFLSQYLWQGGLAAGWIGLQVSLVESMFTLIEEAKLWQMRSGMVFDRPASVTSTEGPAVVPSAHDATVEPATAPPAAKVA